MKPANLPEHGSINVIPKRIQQLQNAFAFMLAFPAIDILGNSLYFYILILILIYHVHFNIRFIVIDKTALLFLLIFFSGAISSIFHPYFERHPGNIFIINNIFHFFYWMIIAIYFKTHYRSINWKKIDRSIFYGVIALIVGYYLLSFRFTSALLNLNTGISRNGFVFNLLCFTPFAMRHALNAYKKTGIIIVCIVIFSAMMLSNGRAGGAIIIGELLLIFLFVFKTWYKALRIIIIVLIPTLILAKNINIEPYLLRFSYQIERLNPRFAELLRGEEAGDLETDKSWLIRKLMVTKSIEIFKEYPIFGIGWYGFTIYDSQLYSLKEFKRLGYQSTYYFNKKSAHNSYAQFLAECGIVGAVLLLWILITPVLFTLNKFLRNRQTIVEIPLIGLLAMLTHFYVIAALYGANTWFIIGIAYGIMGNRQSLVNKRN